MPLSAQDSTAKKCYTIPELRSIAKRVIWAGRCDTLLGLSEQKITVLEAIIRAQMEKDRLSQVRQAEMDTLYTTCANERQELAVTADKWRTKARRRGRIAGISTGSSLLLLGFILLK